jgi:signal transduction histidine kinase
MGATQFHFFFLSILIFQCVFMFIAASWLRKKDILFYCLFLLSLVFTYGVSHIDRITNVPNALGNPIWYRFFSFPILPLSFAIYYYFIIHFLELEKYQKSLYNLLRINALLCVICFILFGSFALLNIPYQGFFFAVGFIYYIVTFYLVFTLWRSRIQYGRIILAGTIFTTIGSLVGLAVFYYSSHQKNIANRIDSFIFTEIGIVFDIFLYSLGLYKKWSDSEKKLVIEKLEKQRAIELERNRIAEDMHDDLGSGLTKITYLSQMALGKENHEGELNNIKNTSRGLVESMNEIIWAMKEENNSIEDLIYYIKSYAVEYCSNNNLECIIIIPESFKPRIVKGQNRRNIYLAIKEVLHNIVKHAAAKHIVISVIFDQQWIVAIQDDGKGIDLTKQSNRLGGNGLHNIKKRIESVNGTVTVENNKGTLVTLRIPA